MKEFLAYTAIFQIHFNAKENIVQGGCILFQPLLDGKLRDFSVHLFDNPRGCLGSTLTIASVPGHIVPTVLAGTSSTEWAQKYRHASHPLTIQIYLDSVVIFSLLGFIKT